MPTGAVKPVEQVERRQAVWGSGGKGAGGAKVRTHIRRHHATAKQGSSHKIGLLLYK